MKPLTVLPHPIFAWSLFAPEEADSFTVKHQNSLQADMSAVKHQNNLQADMSAVKDQNSLQADMPHSQT